MQRLFHPMTAEALLCEEAMPGGGVQERSLLSYGLGDGSVINMEMRVRLCRRVQLLDELYAVIHVIYCPAQA